MGDSSSSDDAMMVTISEALIAAVDGALAAWVTAAVASRAEGLDAQTSAAAELASAQVGAELRELLALDVDAQRTTPLAVLRAAFRYPTAVLAAAGIEPVRRDPFDVRMSPDDLYSLAPATWSDFGPEVGEAGLVWGAAKAHLHLSRHR